VPIDQRRSLAPAPVAGSVRAVGRASRRTDHPGNATVAHQAGVQTCRPRTR
jgi:hypothetical protein